MTLIVLCLYAWSYVALSSRMQVSVGSTGHIFPPRHARLFRSQWEAKLFAPALKVESLLAGEEIHAAWR